jgi:hypothetical protein
LRNEKQNNRDRKTLTPINPRITKTPKRIEKNSESFFKVFKDFEHILNGTKSGQGCRSYNVDSRNVWTGKNLRDVDFQCALWSTRGFYDCYVYLDQAAAIENSTNNNSNRAMPIQFLVLCLYYFYYFVLHTTGLCKVATQLSQN